MLSFASGNPHLLTLIAVLMRSLFLVFQNMQVTSPFCSNSKKIFHFNQNITTKQKSHHLFKRFLVRRASQKQYLMFVQRFVFFFLDSIVTMFMRAGKRQLRVFLRLFGFLKYCFFNVGLYLLCHKLYFCLKLFFYKKAKYRRGQKEFSLRPASIVNSVAQFRLGLKKNIHFRKEKGISSQFLFEFCEIFLTDTAPSYVNIKKELLLGENLRVTLQPYLFRHKSKILKPKKRFFRKV
jgi:hypothetical protein